MLATAVLGEVPQQHAVLHGYLWLTSTFVNAPQIVHLANAEGTSWPSTMVGNPNTQNAKGIRRSCR
jgi:hypothetical protein